MRLSRIEGSCRKRVRTAGRFGHKRFLKLLQSMSFTMIGKRHPSLSYANISPAILLKAMHSRRIKFGKKKILMLKLLKKICT